MLLADIGLGFVARTVPQMNVFVLGFSIKILLGMLVLMFMVPLLVDILKVEIEKAIALALKGVYLWR
ncbi:flagellar biosynthetic protein FliR, partial [Vibrio parahaemolyticus]|nr:flagellar biosynthetic protein FliR [Vibrio parahaemolyticus]